MAMRFALLSLLSLTVAAACSDRPRIASDAAAPLDAAGDASAPEGRPCGGFAANPCEATQYCDYPDGSCGAGDQTGTCAVRPMACPQVVDPVCGCGGRIYNTACLAAAAGVDLSAGGCTAPAGKFGCGTTFCDLASSYCLHDASRPEPDTYRCVALPACTEPQSCACLGHETCGDACTGDAASGLTLSCP